MGRVLVLAVMSLVACSKSERALGQLPEHAGEMFAALCAGSKSGPVQPDDKFERMRLACELKPRPDLESVRCGPEDPEHSNRNVMVFEAKTRRLLCLDAVVQDADLAMLEQLLLPTFGPTQLAGYEVEKARRSVESLAGTNHSWNDSHTMIWSARGKDHPMDGRWTLNRWFSVGVVVQN